MSDPGALSVAAAHLRQRAEDAYTYAAASRAMHDDDGADWNGEDGALYDAVAALLDAIGKNHSEVSPGMDAWLGLIETKATAVAAVVVPGGQP